MQNAYLFSPTGHTYEYGSVQSYYGALGRPCDCMIGCFELWGTRRTSLAMERKCTSRLALSDCKVSDFVPYQNLIVNAMCTFLCKTLSHQPCDSSFLLSCRIHTGPGCLHFQPLSSVHLCWPTTPQFREHPGRCANCI